jgi:hypothetical protein
VVPAPHPAADFRAHDRVLFAESAFLPPLASALPCQDFHHSHGVVPGRFLGAVMVCILTLLEVGGGAGPCHARRAFVRSGPRLAEGGIVHHRHSSCRYFTWKFHRGYLSRGTRPLASGEVMIATVISSYSPKITTFSSHLCSRSLPLTSCNGFALDSTGHACLEPEAIKPEAGVDHPLAFRQGLFNTCLSSSVTSTYSSS